MHRNVAQLANITYDLLVVGGGISGAFVAWDAALRGLSVALVERGDFGHATSSNSLKTIHGGLRYLQDADLKLVRMMIRERMVFMRIAPHLVHPLPCIMPTYKNMMKSKAAMAAALLANDLVGFDRNRLDDPQKHLPRGRVISRNECLRLLPGIADDGITGGALWYDAQMHNSERLTLSVVLSAAQAGADVANYVEAVTFLRKGNKIQGIRAKDVLTNEELEIRAKMVVNAAGPWVDYLLDSLNNGRPHRRFRLSTAMNLVTRQIIPHYAVGITSRSKDTRAAQNPRMLFISPWRRYSLLGTIHSSYNGTPDDYRVTEQSIQTFIDEVNHAYPGGALTRNDVYFVHKGFLPAQATQQEDSVKLVRQGQIHDHQNDDRVEGLITVVGVKYTTARNIAEQAVNLVFEKLGKQPSPCRTHLIPLHGGRIERLEAFLEQEINMTAYGLGSDVIQHLVYNYGLEYRQVLRYLDDDSTLGQTVRASSAVIKAEILHAVREEMAMKLTDVLFRRTELASPAYPGNACLQTCADLIAPTLGWSETKTQQELEEVKAIFSTLNTQQTNDA